MTERTNEILPLSNLMENFSSDLTVDEMEAALKTAVRVKRAEENRRRYSKILLEPSPGFQVPSYEEIDGLFKLAYKKNEGVNFEETEFNKKPFHILKLYFSQDPRFEVKEGFSFSKGLIVQGPVGCCKTSMINAFRLIGFMGFLMISCKELTRMFSKDGFGSIDKYLTLKIDSLKRERGFFYDDLGWEGNGRFYGQDVSVMGEVLEHLNTHKKFKYSILTTNNTVDQLEERYGSRLISRMRQGYNQVSYDPESTDMRK